MPPKMGSLATMPTGKKRSADEIAGLDKSNKPLAKRQALGTNIVQDVIYNAVKVSKNHDSKQLYSPTSDHTTVDLVSDDEGSSCSSERESITEPLIVLKDFREPRENSTQFSNGDTYIKLDIGTGISRLLRLNAKDLNRASPILKDMLKHPVEEPNPDMAKKFKTDHGTANRLELVYDTASKLHVLTRVSLTVEIKQKEAVAPARGGVKPVGSSISGHVTTAASKTQQVSISHQNNSDIIDTEYSSFTPPVVAGTEKKVVAQSQQATFARVAPRYLNDNSSMQDIEPRRSGLLPLKKKDSKFVPQYDGSTDSVDESLVDQKFAVKEEDIENSIEAERTRYTALTNSSTDNATDVTMVDGKSVRGDVSTVKQEGAGNSGPTYGVGGFPMTVEQDTEPKHTTTMLEGVEDATSTHIEEHVAINSQDTSGCPHSSLNPAEEVPKIDEPIASLDKVTLKQDGIKTTPVTLEMMQAEWLTANTELTSTQLRWLGNETEKEPSEKTKADFQSHDSISDNAIVIDDDIPGSIKLVNQEVNSNAIVLGIKQPLPNNENSEATKPEALVPVTEIKQHATSKPKEVQAEKMSSISLVQNTADKLARDTIRVDHASSKTSKKEEVIIKQENLHQKPVSATKDKHQLSRDYFAAYENLFLIFCNKPPITPLNDINKLLRQAEILIRLSQYYKSGNLIPIHIRLYLSHAFNHYDRDMRLAILDDPPRWLNLAMQLESAPMFKEAAIHIVANFPSVPWSTRLNEILHRREVHSIFKRKAEELKSLKASIDASLINNGIECDGEVVRICFHSSELYHISMVVNMWRDWYLDGIEQAEEDDQANSKKKPLTNAKMYRELAGHPAEYLRLDTVIKTIQAQKGEEPLTKVEEDEITTSLHIMKQQARRLVASLCINNSMLTVEKSGIEYFTCIKIEDDELPWMEKDDN